jgi:hypothetical protein
MTYWFNTKHATSPGATSSLDGIPQFLISFIHLLWRIGL